MKYYYENGTKALYMRQEFNMEFTTKFHHPRRKRVSDSYLITQATYDSLAPCVKKQVIKNQRIYIDSAYEYMSIPQVGDLVIQRGNIRLQDKIGTIAPGSKQKDIFFIEADYMDDAKAHEGALIHRVHVSKIEIIQRNGKAFFMPEAE